MRKARYSDEDLKRVIKESISIRETLKKLGIRPAGGNYKTLKNKISNLKIDISHFRGQGWNLGGNQNWTARPLSGILIENSTYTSTGSLKKRLIKEGLVEEKCYNCERTKWIDGKIPLELEHKNGNNMDNRIENLTLLCPNCHALTPTYRGRNINVAKKHKKRKNKKIKPEGHKKLMEIDSGLLQHLVDQHTLREIGMKFDIGWRLVSKICENRKIKVTRKKRIEKRKFHVGELELRNLIQTKSFCEIGRMFGVSDNAIRKRAKSMGLLKKEIGK